MRNFYTGLIYFNAAALALPCAFAYTCGGLNREGRHDNSALAPAVVYTNGNTGFFQGTAYASSMPVEAS